MGSIFGFERRQFAPEPVISPFYSGDSPALNRYVGVKSDADLALTVSACWAAVSLLSHTVSSLSLESFKQPADLTAPPKPVADPPLIRAPAAGVTQSEWLDQIMVSLLTAGNAYGHIVGREDMPSLRPTQIEIMSPKQLIVEVDDDTGAVTYRSRKTRTIIPSQDIWHLAGMTLPGEKIGLSPIAYAAAVLGIDISSRKFAADFFDGGGIPKAIITTDQFVDKPKAILIKDRFMSAIRNREPMVIGNGVKYQQISVRPEESQFLKTQEANIGHVARYYGVPAGMIGGTEGGGMTYTNREQRALDFKTYSVSWWLKRIEQSLSMLLAGPNFVQFKTDDLLRTDAETAATIDVQMVAAKIFAPSEIRTKRGAPPMTQEQLDETALVPLTITPQGKAKAIPPGKQLPPDPADPGFVPPPVAAPAKK